MHFNYQLADLLSGDETLQASDNRQHIILVRLKQCTVPHNFLGVLALKAANKDNSADKADNYFVNYKYVEVCHTGVKMLFAVFKSFRFLSRALRCCYYLMRGF